MSTELKSHQYKQQMTFSDSEINSNANKKNKFRSEASGCFFD